MITFTIESGYIDSYTQNAGVYGLSRMDAREPPSGVHGPGLNRRLEHQPRGKRNGTGRGGR